MTTDRKRAERYAILMDPELLEAALESAGAWYESPEEVQGGLKWGERKARLLRWVRAEMERSLTARERQCVDLYYFQGLSLQEAGAVTGTKASSVSRALRRAVGKLRRAAVRTGPAPLPRWRRGAQEREQEQE